MNGQLVSQRYLTFSDPIPILQPEKFQNDWGRIFRRLCFSVMKLSGRSSSILQSIKNKPLYHQLSFYRKASIPGLRDVSMKIIRFLIYSRVQSTERRFDCEYFLLTLLIPYRIQLPRKARAQNDNTARHSITGPGI